MNSQHIESLFPSLAITGYSINSPATSGYNCIAWAAEDTDVFWWPDRNYIGYWPLEVPREETVYAFIKAFEALGYTVCENADHEDSFIKIAIYVDSIGIPTHAARQLSSGRWTSKLGRLEDIEHNTLDGIAEYGSVAVLMKRPKKC